METLYVTWRSVLVKAGNTFRLRTCLAYMKCHMLTVSVSAASVVSYPINGLLVV